MTSVINTTKGLENDEVPKQEYDFSKMNYSSFLTFLEKEVFSIIGQINPKSSLQGMLQLKGLLKNSIIFQHLPELFFLFSFRPSCQSIIRTKQGFFCSKSARFFF
jgi:hypothetical protein